MLSTKSAMSAVKKAAFPALMSAIVMLAGFVGPAPAVQALNQTWTGTISASHCGLSHPDGASPRDCTLECVEGGAAFVLVSSGQTYTFADQADARLRAHAGSAVTVKGEVHGNVITATTIVEGREK